MTMVGFIARRNSGMLEVGDRRDRPFPSLNFKFVTIFRGLQTSVISRTFLKIKVNTVSSLEIISAVTSIPVCRG